MPGGVEWEMYNHGAASVQAQPQDLAARRARNGAQAAPGRVGRRPGCRPQLPRAPRARPATPERRSVDRRARLGRRHAGRGGASPVALFPAVVGGGVALRLLRGARVELALARPLIGGVRLLRGASQA